MAAPRTCHGSALNRTAPISRSQAPPQATQHMYKIPATNKYHRSYREKIVIEEKTDSHRAHSRKRIATCFSHRQHVSKCFEVK